MKRSVGAGVMGGLVLLVVGACAAPERPALPRQARQRLTPGYAANEHIARGERRDLPLAELFVPDGYSVPADGRVPLFLHFQGAVWAAEENFVRFARPGVLIASRLAGFSSAFSTPYRDPQAFTDLLVAGEAALTARSGRPVHFAPVTITFWSAGYGAVREFLKCPAHFARIDALVSADSIYADVVSKTVRAPRIEHMAEWLAFAQAAARGEKNFVLAHGLYQTDYASTAETAALLVAAVAGQMVPGTAPTERGVPIAAEVHVGGFHCYRFAEATAGIHVDCLYFVPELVRRHVPVAAPVGGQGAPVGG